MTDRDIVALFFARDERAIAEFDRSLGALCYKIALDLSGDPGAAGEVPQRHEAPALERHPSGKARVPQSLRRENHPEPRPEPDRKVGSRQAERGACGARRNRGGVRRFL